MNTTDYSLICSIVLATLLATGSALLLIRRGPTRRLRQLALTVSLISLAQTVKLVHRIWVADPLDSRASSLRHLSEAALSLMAIYILGIEIRDRKAADRHLRLLEHAVPLARKEGSGFRFLRAVGLKVSSDRVPSVGMPAPVARGSVVRVTAHGCAPEGILGEVTDCSQEVSGRTYIVTIRVGLTREETVAAQAS